MQSKIRKITYKRGLGRCKSSTAIDSLSLLIFGENRRSKANKLLTWKLLGFEPAAAKPRKRFRAAFFRCLLVIKFGNAFTCSVFLPSSDKNCHNSRVRRNLFEVIPASKSLLFSCSFEATVNKVSCQRSRALTESLFSDCLDLP